MKNPINLACWICCLFTTCFYLWGFVLADGWPGVIVVSAFALLWLFPRRFQPKWWSSAKLLGYIGIAGGGILNNVSPFLLIAGVTFALASWELESQRSDSSTPGITSAQKSYERLHLSKLCVVLVIGLAAAEAGLFLKFTLPFGVVFLIASVVVFSLFRLFHILLMQSTDGIPHQKQD